MRVWGWLAGSVSLSDKSPDEIVNPSSHFSIDSLKRLLMNAAIFQHEANWTATSETNQFSYHLTGKLKVLKIQCIPWVSIGKLHQT